MIPAKADTAATAMLSSERGQPQRSLRVEITSVDQTLRRKGGRRPRRAAGRARQVRSGEWTSALATVGPGGGPQRDTIGSICRYPEDKFPGRSIGLDEVVPHPADVLAEQYGAELPEAVRIAEPCRSHRSSRRTRCSNASPHRDPHSTPGCPPVVEKDRFRVGPRTPLSARFRPLDGAGLGLRRVWMVLAENPRICRGSLRWALLGSEQRPAM